jgi:hypothetical protein
VIQRRSHFVSKMHDQSLRRWSAEFFTSPSFCLFRTASSLLCRTCKQIVALNLNPIDSPLGIHTRFSSHLTVCGLEA